MSERVLGVLGGMDVPDSQLRAWASAADVLYAADSAADRLVAMGFAPTVVGDMDSVSAAVLGLDLRFARDDDPSRTDCDKLLALVEADGYGSVTIACLEGDLLDHALAALFSIVRCPLRVDILLRSGVAHVLRGGDVVTLPGMAGRRVSFLPLLAARGASLRGVTWAFEEEDLEPTGFHSVSNQGLGDLSASIRAGAAILVVSEAGR